MTLLIGYKEGDKAYILADKRLVTACRHYDGYDKIRKVSVDREVAGSKVELSVTYALTGSAHVTHVLEGSIERTLKSVPLDIQPDKLAAEIAVNTNVKELYSDFEGVDYCLIIGIGGELYEVIEGLSFKRNDFMASGSGCRYALGILQHLKQEGNLNLTSVQGIFKTVASLDRYVSQEYDVEEV